MPINAARLVVRQAHTKLTDEAAAVADLVEQLQPQEAAVVLFFCSARFDLDKLGRAFAESFAAPLVGCTTAGQIGSTGYVDGGITAVSLASTETQIVWIASCVASGEQPDPALVQAFEAQGILDRARSFARTN